MTAEYVRKIKKLIADKSGHEPSEIDNDSYFEEDLNIGEMDLMEILEQLEDELQIELVDQKEAVVTVQNLIDLVEEQIE